MCVLVTMVISKCSEYLSTTCGSKESRCWSTLCILGCIYFYRIPSRVGGIQRNQTILPWELSACIFCFDQRTTAWFVEIDDEENEGSYSYMYLLEGDCSTDMGNSFISFFGIVFFFLVILLEIGCIRFFFLILLKVKFNTWAHFKCFFLHRRHMCDLGKTFTPSEMLKKSRGYVAPVCVNLRSLEFSTPFRKCEFNHERSFTF